MNLYQLTNEIERILIEGTDPISGEIAAECLEALEALEGDKEQKLLDIACAMKGEECEAAAVRHRIAEMEKRAKRHDGRAASLRLLLQRGTTPGSQRLADDRVSVAWKRNPPAAIGDDETKAPDDYMRVIPATAKPDKTAIKAAIKAGKEVPGWRVVSAWRLEVE